MPNYTIGVGGITTDKEAAAATKWIKCQVTYWLAVKVIWKELVWSELEEPLDPARLEQTAPRCQNV